MPREAKHNWEYDEGDGVVTGVCNDARPQRARGASQVSSKSQVAGANKVVRRLREMYRDEEHGSQQGRARAAKISNAALKPALNEKFLGDRRKKHCRRNPNEAKRIPDRGDSRDTPVTWRHGERNKRLKNRNDNRHERSEGAGALYVDASNDNGFSNISRTTKNRNQQPNIENRHAGKRRNEQCQERNAGNDSWASTSDEGVVGRFNLGDARLIET